MRGQDVSDRATTCARGNYSYSYFENDSSRETTVDEVVPAPCEPAGPHTWTLVGTNVVKDSEFGFTIFWTWER
jgi:hypothetical protein